MKTLWLATTLGVLALMAAPACSTYSEEKEDGNASKSSPIGAANDDANGGTNEPSSAECPQLMAPQASDCPGGTWVERKNASGCVSGWDCITCPSVMAPQASDCPGGTWVERKNANGCVSGFDCVTCPSVMAPQASDCPNGTWVERKNANGCVAGFDCVKN